MERLKVILGGVVVVLALVLAFGVVFGGDDDEGDGGTTAAQATAPAPDATTEPAPENGAGGATGTGDNAERAKNGAAPNGGAAGEGGDGGGSGGGKKADRSADASGPGGDGAGAAGKPDEGGGSNASATSRARYVERGDRICARVPKKVAQRLQRLEREGDSKSTPENFLRDAAIPPVRAAAGEFGRLDPPRGDERKAAAIVAALEAAADGLERAASGAGNEPGLGLSGGESPFAEFTKLTGRYGFERCSQF